MAVRFRIGRRVVMSWVWMLLGTAAVVLVAVAINLAGIHFAGDVDGWQRWLRSHASAFLMWRLCLYAATGYGWWRMRQRVYRRDTAPEAHRRLQRAEMAAVVAIVLLEGSTWLPHA